MKTRFFFILLALALSACAPAATLTAVPITSRDTCPVTRPPDPAFTPPAPYPQKPQGAYFYYGTANLWTALPEDGVWSQLPKQGAGYTQKTVWWRAGYNPGQEPMPDLALTGRRLDAPAGPLQSDRATNATAADIGDAMMVGLVIPTSGCWEITGRYKGAELTYVVWIDM